MTTEDPREPYSIRQVIVWRGDLKVRKGKFGAQVAHASMNFLTKPLLTTAYLENPNGSRAYRGVGLTKVEWEWLENSFAKIVLQVSSEEELLEVHEKALAAGLESHLVTDSGQTEFAGVPTNTCIAIGPDYKEKIDPITKDLKLY